ncbi:MAG: SDR family oxidoreductase [Candidatus Aenigmarchaeota archaeon]|nr:SDR family oxidoreductase [Candidatus Aenigmarchaeota archaeon]
MRDKVAVITGGGKGFGKELSKAIAEEGSYVIICSRNRDDLKNVCNEIISNGGKCDYFVLDVTDKKQVEKFVDKVITKYKKIDILINNAGYVNQLEGIEKISDKEFDNCFKANVYSIFHLLKKVVPIMRKQSNSMIINISSMAGKRGVPNLAAYSASKFAVLGLTQSVAKELKDSGIFCIAVCPGGMSTEMRTKAFGWEDAKKQQSPQYVANVVKDVLMGKIKVPHGGDIVIRNGKITAINAPLE